MTEECHISSLVVHVRPERAAALSARIAQFPGTEMQACDVPGKLIVTLETESTAEIVERLNAIHDLPGVISAALIYHHWESAGGAVAEAESEADHGPFPPQVSQG